MRSFVLVVVVLVRNWLVPFQTKSPSANCWIKWFTDQLCRTRSQAFLPQGDHYR